MDVVHVTVRGDRRVVRTATTLTCMQIGRVPIPPVVFGVRFLVIAVVLFGFAQEFGKICYVQRTPARLLPFRAWKSRCNLLQQPAVAIGILEGSERAV